MGGEIGPLKFKRLFLITFLIEESSRLLRTAASLFFLFFFVTTWNAIIGNNLRFKNNN